MINIKHFLYLNIYSFLGILIVFYIVDFPVLKSYKKESAAIAIRDNVSNLEKNGSLFFTQSYLYKKYKRSIYITQNASNDYKNQFIDSLTYLLKTYSTVDIYFLAHHNWYYKLLHKIDTNLLHNINLIYNTGCGNAKDYKTYKELGADVYIGHKGRQSLSPIFYFYFLRRIFTEFDYKNHTDVANQRLLRVLTLIGKEKEIKEHEGILY